MICSSIAIAGVGLVAVAVSQKLDQSPIQQGRPSGYTLREVGSRNTEGWRVWLEKDHDPVSFWHDVPLWPDENNKAVVNFVVEVPRWTNGKVEIKRDEPMNPLFHDSLFGSPRFVESVWPHKSYPFLYGSIPQTWEDPNFNHSFTGLIGDNDPVDLFDVGQDPGYAGQIKQIKVLGSLALADGGETDWKVIGIDVNDPIANLVDSFEDLEKYRPGEIQTFYNWWTYYKVARGDPIIPIIGSKYQSVSFSVDTITHSHALWAALIGGKSNSNEINYNQTTYKELNSYIKSRKATKAFKLPKKPHIQKPTKKPEKFDHWYYLDEKFRLIPGNNDHA